MHLYNVTLQTTSLVMQACVGNFTGISKEQCIILGRNSTLELIKVDPTTGTLHSIYQQQIFGIIRSLVPFKLTGSKKGFGRFNPDFVVLGTDSGRIVVLEYDPEKNLFVKLQQETFGKSGIRRGIPGQYLASDPCGRAVMIGTRKLIQGQLKEQNSLIS
jgi:splicing factor 3B subunit 3